MLKSTQATIRSFRVIPDLPEPLQPLLEIANNLWWTWHPEAASLFRRLDRELWRESNRNPVLLLGRLDQKELDKAAEDRSYLHALGNVFARLREHLERDAWFQVHAAQRSADAPPPRIAYFSAEFGLTECLQIYSGGLGCLAGDHLKSASELGVPLVGVGLLYRCGYFHQYLNADGWQQETYPEIDFANQPLRRVMDPATGKQRRIQVELPGRTLTVAIWRCDVGRVPLFLLDTNVPSNCREDRAITRNLYGGDVETRIKQEIVLGIGGMRALAALGIEPTVFHMNEGHSAFLSLEHIRRLREAHGVDFEPARRAAASRHLFTTHTPVPAGIDRFSPELIETYFSHMLEPLGVPLDRLLALGRENPFDRNEFFSMAVLALRNSEFCNGVSRLHGRVSRSMWRNIWPGVPEHEAPIGHVTNGVHARSWLAPEIMLLLDRYCGSSWLEDPTDESAWANVDETPDDELWQAHVEQRRKLIRWARTRISAQLKQRGGGPEEIEAACAALDGDVFTIGFARRFATYKRATLLLQDEERLLKLLEDTERPIQVLIAGKAHPADAAGKELIRHIVNLSKKGGAVRRIAFIEDYDMAVARRLIRGCDIWLNTPQRGLEASGTSGMKAAMNGVINVSILDGWWDEGYESDLGFAIGRGETYDDPTLQDQVESRALYDLLERQILPEFYNRSVAGTPRKWVARMKRCMKGLTPRFNTNRMVAEYSTKYYLPAYELGARINAGDLSEAIGLAEHIERYRALWPSVSVESVETTIGAQVRVRSKIRVNAVVALGELDPDEVCVQLYHGDVTSIGDLLPGEADDMTHSADLGEGRHEFTGVITVESSGQRGFTVRVIPNDNRLHSQFVPGLITWHHDESPVESESPAPAHQPRAVAASGGEPA